MKRHLSTMKNDDRGRPVEILDLALCGADDGKVVGRELADRVNCRECVRAMKREHRVGCGCHDSPVVIPSP